MPLATAWSLFTKASMYCACAVQSCSGSMLRLSCHNRICGNQNKLVASTLIVALQIQLSMLHEMLVHLNTVQITTPLVLRCGA